MELLFSFFLLNQTHSKIGPMLTLFLISGFTAFFYAIVNQIFGALLSLVDASLIRAVICLSISAGGTAIAGTPNMRQFVLYSACSAFIASFFLVVVERITTYQAAVIRAVGGKN